VAPQSEIDPPEVSRPVLDANQEHRPQKPKGITMLSPSTRSHLEPNLITGKHLAYKLLRGLTLPQRAVAASTFITAGMGLVQPTRDQTAAIFRIPGLALRQALGLPLEEGLAVLRGERGLVEQRQRLANVIRKYGVAETWDALVAVLDENG
jgi:hypothetical protein